MNSFNYHYLCCLILISSFPIETFPKIIWTQKSCECGIGSSPIITPKVTRGTRASIERYPWMAFLSIKDYGSCSGFLIDSSHIMTAAHCLMKNDKIFPPDSVEIYLGFDKKSEFNKPHKINKVMLDSYNNTAQDNDIAILQLSRSVNFTKRIRPICLPEHDQKRYRKLIIAGFGITEPEIDSKFLMHAKVDHLPNPECNLIAQENGHYGINDKKICIHNENSGASACPGDSGGPLMYQKDGRFYALGIASYILGSVCGDKPGVTVYTKVNKLLANAIGDNEKLSSY